MPVEVPEAAREEEGAGVNWEELFVGSVGTDSVDTRVDSGFPCAGTSSVTLTPIIVTKVSPFTSVVVIAEVTIVVIVVGVAVVVDVATFVVVAVVVAVVVRVAVMVVVDEDDVEPPGTEIKGGYGGR